MANFNIPNLCGASEELNAASIKISSLENEITSKLDAAASDAAAAFDAALTDVKAGLDGLALDLPEAPNVNFQSELTSLIKDIDKTTIEGIAAFSNKLAELENDFGETLKEKGLTLDSVVSDATTKLATGGDVCALAPNIEIPAANSGTGVTTEEKELSVLTGLTVIALPEDYKEVLSVEGKSEGSNFFGNIVGYKVKGRIITIPKSYVEVKVKYIISFIKEKPVEVKQAIVPPEKEEVSSVTVNTSVVEVRESLKTKQQDIDTGEIFSKPDDTGFVKKADPVKDVEPVVTKSGGTISVTTPAKSNVVTTETITTTTGGGYTQTYSAPVTKRKVQSDKGFTTRKKRRIEFFVLKGSINETFWTAPGLNFSGKRNVPKHKVTDDISRVILKYPFDDIINIKITVERKAIDPTATKSKDYYGRSRASGYKRLDYAVGRKSKSAQKQNELSYEFPYEDNQKLVEVINDASGQPQVDGTRIRISYDYLEKVDPNFSG